MLEVSRFFQKIGVEINGKPVVTAGSLSKGQFYFTDRDSAIYVFKGNNRRERKITEIAYRKAGGKLVSVG